jgi:hypothetical protein
MGRTIAQVSKQTLILQEYLEKQKAGASLSYLKIAQDTGVEMDERGKQYLRTALHRAKLESTTEIKYGITLADKDNAMEIITHKLNKVDRSVRRGERTHKNIQEKFFDSLPLEKQKEILYLGAVFGAIRVASENGRIIYSNKTKQLNAQINIPMPKI